MNVIRVLSVFLFLSLFLSSCASRGFKLSQQMPGMDNNLDPIKSSYGEYSTYQIAKDGSIQFQEARASEEADKKRSVASKELSADVLNLGNKIYIESESPFVGSTLDPENGAILLSTQVQE